MSVVYSNTLNNFIQSMPELNAAAAAAKSLQSCPTLCDPIDGSPLGSCPWDSPGKNTGVGCHFLLQYRKVKSESEVAQSCGTLCDPMDCSLRGSVHRIFQARVLEWLAIEWSNGFPYFLQFKSEFGIRSSWYEPQSAPSLVFAECIELLHLWLQRI